VPAVSSASTTDIDCYPRGVFVAPWLGEHGELVLLARTSRRTLIPGTPLEIPHGASRLDASDRLWKRLDELDPVIKIV
jgi:hypothetical protein